MVSAMAVEVVLFTVVAAYRQACVESPFLRKALQPAGDDEEHCLGCDLEERSAVLKGSCPAIELALEEGVVRDLDLVRVTPGGAAQAQASFYDLGLRSACSKERQ